MSDATLISSIPVAFSMFGAILPQFPINPAAALAVPAFWGGCRLISETTASLPGRVLQRQGCTTTPIHDHPVASLLNRSASPGTLAYTARQVWALHACLTGNGYMRILRRGGKVIGFENLDPYQVMPFKKDGEKWYSVTGDDLPLHSDDVLHLHLMSYDGIRGLDPIATLAPTFDLAALTDQFSRRYLRKGAHLNGYIEGTNLTKDQIEQLRANFSGFEGIENTGKTPVLNNAKYQKVSADLSTVQLELRKQVIVDIATILRVPPALLYQFERTTSESAEQQSAEAITFGLRNWIEQQEAELTAKLLAPQEIADGYEVDIDVGDMLRADPLARASQILALVNAGVYTPNEGRQVLGLPPYPGGDTPRVPHAVTRPMTPDEGAATTGGLDAGATT